MSNSRIGQLSLLAVAIWSATFTRAVLRPLQESMRVDLTLSDNAIAWLQGPALAIPMACASIPLGLLVDRCRRAPLFVIFLTLALAATAMTALAGNMVLLFVARFVAGLSSAGTFIVVCSVLSDLYGPAHRGRAFMVTTFGDVLGAPTAFALGGVLLTIGSASVTRGLDSWRWSVLWMCVPLLVVTFLMLRLREPMRTGIKVENAPARDSWAWLWNNRAIVGPMLLARVMVWIADGAVVVWAAPNFARNYSLPADHIGVIMALALVIAGVLGPCLGGPLADYCQRTGGPRRTMMLMCSAAVLSIPAGLFAIAPDTAVATVLLAAFLTLGFSIGTIEMALATIVVPGELRGLYIAITLTVGSVFSVGIAPLVVSYFSSMLGGGTMIGPALAIVCVTTSIVGAVVFRFGSLWFPANR